MNNSTSHNMSTSQSQRNESSGIGEFFNGLQSYSNFQAENEAPPDEFMWDPNIFTNSQIYSPSVATHTPAWNQNANSQPRDPPLTAYGGLQSSFQLSQYGQPQFDPRQPSPQPGHDPRLISRPSPSPAQYSNQNPQAAMAYRDLQYSNQQQFNPQTMVYPPRPPSSSTPTFDGQTNRSPYFNYGSHMVNPSQLQSMDLSHNLGGFPEQQQQRPAAPYIDPSFLTANAMQRHTPESAQQPYPYLRQENIHPQASGQQAAISTAQANFPGGNPSDGHPGAFIGVFAPPKPDKPAGKTRKPKDPNAPKRPRGRPRKDTSQPSSKQEAETSTSDSDSDELKIVEMPEPTPDLLRGPPPDVPEHKVIYDIATAVWYPRNRTAVAEKVRNGIALFGDVVKKQRDAWKVKNEALKQAELANNANAISDLKMEVAQFRKTIETMAVQALRFGHPAHLAKLGENPFTMSALQSFLVDRINALDMDGSLVTSILKLMDTFTTLDEEMLEKTKTSKILTRLTKKAGNGVRNLAQSVLDHAAVASKRKAASSGKAEGGDSPKPVADQKGATTAGLKRPREADGSLPASKRMVLPTIIKQASKPLALQNAERKKLESAAPKAKIAAPVANGTSSTAPAQASKPPVTAAIPPKPVPSPFSGLMSASKKPGTSNAARAAAAKEKASVPPAPPIKKPSPPPAAVAKPEMHAAPLAKSTFSFMDTLADMTRPKQVEEKKVDDRPPETEEERAKRLRKEERRKLRVSWAPEDELTQIRLFMHDPEEENGHADSAMRDVDDVGGEGRMLKLHKDLEDLDDEDDRAAGDDMEPYRAPSEVDFSVIDDAARQIAFMRRGGFEKPQSAEKEAQDAREQTTLMVVYALPSDVPPTPKEAPAAGDEDDYTPLTSFGDPDEGTRLREAKYYESQRVHEQNTTTTPDLNAILNLMKQNHPQPSQQPAYNAFVPQLQPQQQPAQGVDISKILAVMSQLQQPQQQPQPVTPQPQQQQGAQVNLAALLAQMQGGQQQPAQPAQSLPYGYSGTPNPYPGGVDNDYLRKHGRSDSNGDYDEYAWKKKKVGANSGGAAASTAKPHPKAKTVVCKFWQEGKCKKGDDCTFIHES